VSHFDPSSDYRDFRGFFVLFWIGLAIMVLTSMLRNLKENGYPLFIRQWELFTEKIWELGICDGAMVASTALSLVLHKVISRKYFGWSWVGMPIQSLYQVMWLLFWVTYPFVRDWSWTAQVFFTLHLLSMFMKMHSYAFYNGHLSETLRRLNELDNPKTASKDAAYRYPHARTHLVELPQSPSHEDAEASEKAKLAQLRDDLAFELASPLGRVSYPENLTLSNFVDFIFCPTLCYELEYPRTASIRYLELLYKTLAVFGCIFLLTITTEEFILPVLDESAPRLQASTGIYDFGLILAETIGRLLFPFMLAFLLVFLVIFEYILGAFAEITRKYFVSNRIAPMLTYSRICRPPILRRLVEQLRLARILARMEQACSPLLPKTCLFRLTRPHVSAGGNHYYILRQRSCARACYGLHHSEIPRLRLLRDDDANAHRYGPALQMGQGPYPLKQRTILVLHDPRTRHGRFSRTRVCWSMADWIQMCALYVLV
jgi:hypothetical protein